MRIKSFPKELKTILVLMGGRVSLDEIFGETVKFYCRRRLIIIAGTTTGMMVMVCTFHYKDTSIPKKDFTNNDNVIEYVRDIQQGKI